MPSNSDNILLIVLLFLAIAIGWLLGRRSKTEKPAPSDMSPEYFTGLDYLLNEKIDEAIESFIRALEVNSDTIPAHIALAKLFRRKGDVDRAIQIHQNLLARPDLNHNDFMRIQMALARDYYAVGLLDRAENLLQEIIKAQSSKKTRQKALFLLIKLYEKEGEWEQALSTGEKLTAEGRKQIGNELAHYCCERAEGAIEHKLFKQAAQYLARAEQFNGAHVRISLQQARIAMAQEQWKGAIKFLKQVSKHDRLFISETIEMLFACYQRQGNLRSYLEYLRASLSQTPSTSVMLAIADQVKQEQGLYAAGSFITAELKRHPSVKGFNRLIDLHIEYGSASAKDSLKVLRGLTGQLEMSKPVYRCNSCGFSGRTLSWQCPSCKSWGTTKPIQGLEGE